MGYIHVLIALGVSAGRVLGAPPASPVAPSIIRSVWDEAGLVDSRAKADLSELLARHNQATGEKLVLGVFESAGGESPKTFSRRVFESRRSSVFLALFAQEKEAELVVGYDLEPILSQAEQESLLDGVVRPSLSREGVTQAALQGTLALLDRLESPVGPELAARARLQELASTSASGPSPLWLTGAIALAALVSAGVLCWAALRLSAAEIRLTADGTHAISAAIRDSTQGVAAEIQVHLTRRWPEREPANQARRLLADAGTADRGGRASVILYVNSRAGTFAVVGNDAAHRAVGESYWKAFSNALRDDLLSTSLENAVILAVRTLGATLRRCFPEK